MVSDNHGNYSKDIFISYASEDKPKADLLAKELDNYCIDFWMDKFEIGWGEKIIRKIDEGMTTSRYVLVLVSEAFLDKHWTISELDAALTREINAGSLYVLPIIIGKVDLFKRGLPILATKRYLPWTLGPQKIAEELSVILNREFRKKWVYHHPADYVGIVWVKLRAKGNNSGKLHRYTIRWGPWTRGGQQMLVHNRAVALMHTKGDDGLSIPIFLEIAPESYVSFGRGDPGDVHRVDINKWWIRFRDHIRLWLTEKTLWS